jgi:hypothetical protein
MIKRIYNPHKQKLYLKENEAHIWNFDLVRFLKIKFGACAVNKDNLEFIYYYLDYVNIVDTLLLGWLKR